MNDLNNPLYPIDTLLPIVEFSQTIFNEYNRLHRSGLSVAGSTTSVIDISDSSDFTNLNSWSLSGFRSDIFQPTAFINSTLQSLLSSPSPNTRIIFTNSADLVAKSSNHQNNFIILGTTINEFSMTHELFHMCEQCNISQKICHMNESIDWTNIMHTQTQYPRCEILLNQILSNFDFGMNGAIEDSNFSHFGVPHYSGQ